MHRVRQQRANPAHDIVGHLAQRLAPAFRIDRRVRCRWAETHRDRRVFDLKKVLGVFLAVGLLLVAGSAVAADKTFLSIATGGVAGTYYPLGGGLAQVMKFCKTRWARW